MSAASNKFIYKHYILLLFTDVTKQYWTSQNVFGVTCDRNFRSHIGMWYLNEQIIWNKWEWLLVPKLKP